MSGRPSKFVFSSPRPTKAFGPEFWGKAVPECVDQREREKKPTCQGSCPGRGRAGPRFWIGSDWVRADSWERAKCANGTAPGTRSGCADDLYGRVGESPPKEQPVEGGAEEKKDYISVQVQKQAEAAKTEKKKFRLNGVTTMLEDPTELALKILRDAAETKKQKSRYIIKPVPIEVVTKAAMIFNRRFNNGLERESTINALAEMISAKNRDNKTNLMHPELAVIVEGIVPEFLELRMYNLLEICTWKGEDAKSQESTELADRNGKESGKKVAAENGARRWLLRNGEKKDPAKDEDPSQKELEPDAKRRKMMIIERGCSVVSSSKIAHDICGA
ncbi:conserved hypothetical protein [Culex quinquefasciatus]|uniref:THUMP domain-containing protein n=1 Tax=Culex quinquefasciatus TaxID=7176 RepID=B0XLW9_CULQU|nr:conserved hypothetical protein [Culex quinquefasciatus]|eukprot:XP_001870640.1 conserved hypothetical protein [Culex quinquefasciatus]